MHRNSLYRIALAVTLSIASFPGQSGFSAEPPDAAEQAHYNLQVLGHGLARYMLYNEGKLPARLSELHEQNFVLDLDTFTCPGSGSKIANANEIDEKTDYLLTTKPTVERPQVLLKEKKAFRGGGKILAFYSDRQIRLVAATATDPISTATNLVKVPDVVGLSPKEAKEAILKAGFIPKFDPSEPQVFKEKAYLVYSSTPAAGTMNQRASEVRLLYRDAPSEPKVEIKQTKIASALLLKGHTSGVSSVAFSSDGTRLASASNDQRVKVWDAITGKEMLLLKGHTSGISSVVFSPDGKRLASASRDQTVKVWDAAMGNELLTLKGHSSAISSVAFSPDGKRLASASNDQTVNVWDSATGEAQLTLKGHTQEVKHVIFSPDGKFLASASNDQTVKVWDSRTGKDLLTLKGHTGEVSSVAFSPDGTRLASASYDQTVRIWDAATGREMLNLKGHTGWVFCVAFSPDSKHLASGSGDLTAMVWDADTGKGARVLKGHTNWIWNVAFSPDGKRLVTCSEDQTVRVWDNALGEAFPSKPKDEKSTNSDPGKKP